MLKIKLSRTGKKNQPHYRIVVAEAKSKRDGKVVDRLGSYNPLANPSIIKLNKEKYSYWIKVGAQPTQTVRNLAKKVTS